MVRAFALTFLLAAPLLADGPDKKVVNPGDVDVRFHDGSNVRMTLVSQHLEVLTAYGKLNVPIQDIKQIEFGLHLPDGMETRVEKLIDDLGHAEFKKREVAARDLVALKHFAYPALMKASKSSSAETSKRATAALNKIKSQVPEKFLKLPADDKVVTQKFTIVGKIQTKVMKARTEYFGEVDMALHQVLALRTMGAPADEAELTVEANKYAVPGAWMETDVMLEAQSKLVVTANGQVDQWPQTPGQYMTTANGQRGQMPIAPGGQFVLGKGNQLQLRQFSGALLGKIGEDGPVVFLGAQYSGTPGVAGKLYLCIGPSHWGNPDCSGSYQVKISVKE